MNYRLKAASLTQAPSGSGLTAQETADAVNNLAPVGVSGAAGSIRAKVDAGGAGPWGSGQTYANTITLVAQKADTTRIPGVSWTFKNASGTGIQSKITDLNGAGITTLPDGVVTVIPTASGYTFAVTTATISGDTTITVTGAALAITQPPAGTQTVYYIPDDPALVIDSTAVVTASPEGANQTLGDAVFTGDTVTATSQTTHYEMALAVGGKFRIKGVRGANMFLNVVITVTSAATRSLTDYIEEL